MRFWIAMILGCCAGVGYAQDAAPEEVVVVEESDDNEEVAAVDSHQGGKPGGCGCGKPK